MTWVFVIIVPVIPTTILVYVNLEEFAHQDVLFNFSL